MIAFLASCLPLLLFSKQTHLSAIAIQKNENRLKSLHFLFGTAQKTTKKSIALRTAAVYDSKIGYGFDLNTAANIQLTDKALHMEKPCYFSIKLPEGNYKVELDFISPASTAHISVKAESRRLMIKELAVQKATKSFNVNIRSIGIPDGNRIEMQEREKTDLNWDDKLTLEFSGNAGIQSIKISPLKKTRTVYLAGDSTVTDQDLEPWASWGQFITNYFDQTIVVANYAVSGSALSSFKASNRLKKIESLIKAGDYLMIEFGHNDQKLKGEENSAWRSYSELLAYFVQAARSKGAVPILLTPTQRRFFNTDGTLKPTHGDFPAAMRAVAKKMNVPLIDLTKMSSLLYESWGEEASRKAFVQYPANTFPAQEKAIEDNTHFNSFGAHEIALCITKGIRELDLPLKKQLTKETPLYNPQNPNVFSKWTLPMSNRFEIVKPEGN